MIKKLGSDVPYFASGECTGCKQVDDASADRVDSFTNVKKTRSTVGGGEGAQAFAAGDGRRSRSAYWLTRAVVFVVTESGVESLLVI